MITDATVTTAEQASMLLDSPEVAHHWHEPSSLPYLSVGALACYLHQIIARLAQLLDEAEPATGTVVSTGAYYGTNRLTATATERESGFHPMLRAMAEEMAQRGPDVIATATAGAVTRLRAQLATVTPERLVPVPHLPGKVTSLGDYLRTRCAELLIHTDALATSCGVTTPRIPREASEAALGVLIPLARYAGGDLAVLRDLARMGSAPPGAPRSS